MFEFKKFSVEVIDHLGHPSLIDYSSYEIATRKARAMTRDVPPRMINVIAWDTTCRHAINEWVILSNYPPLSYEPSSTHH